MRHSGIVNLRNSKFFQTVSKNNIVIILSLFFVVGIIIGVVAVRNDGVVSDMANTALDNYIISHSGTSFVRLFLNSFLGFLPFALIIFICGTSLVGIALTPIAITYRGFSYGIMTAYLYSKYLIHGIAFNSIILIPANLFALFGFLLIGREAFNFSLQLARISMPKGQSVGFYNDFKTYCKKIILYLLFVVCAALLDAVMCLSFMKFFKF